jgi:hypothetical protein
MIPSVLEKLGYITVVVILFLQSRVRVPDLVLAIFDLIFRRVIRRRVRSHGSEPTKSGSL